MKPVFGRFTAVTAIQERGRLQAEIAEAIRAALEGTVVVLTSVQVEDIAFSDAYERAIEDRMQAEVSVTTARQTAERLRVDAEGQAARDVITAQGQAAARIAEAEGEAERTRLQAAADAEAAVLRGDASASAVRARGEALRDNPMLTQLVAAERWNGVLPTTMVPGSVVPFISLPGAQ